MAKEKILFEKEELVEAVKELNELLFDEEHAIDTKQKEGALQQAIVDASVLLNPKDKVSKETLKMIKALKDAGIAPAPEEEEEEEEDVKGAEEETEEEETEEEEEEEPVKKDKEKETTQESVIDLDDLFEKVDSAKTRKDLLPILKGSALFAEQKEDLLDIDEFKSLQEEMLDIIEDAQDAAKKSKKATKKEEPVKKDKEKEEKKEKESPKAGKKPDFGKRGDESFPAMAERFLKEEASEKEILAAYTKAYKERKDVTDEKFIKARIAIYMKLAKEKAEKKSK